MAYQDPEKNSGSSSGDNSGSSQSEPAGATSLSFTIEAAKTTYVSANLTGSGDALAFTNTQIDTRARDQNESAGNNDNLMTPVDATKEKARILIIGDSWAEYMWSKDDCTPLRKALGEYGDTLVGELTGILATQARQWAKPNLNLPNNVPAANYTDLLRARKTRGITIYEGLASLELITKTLAYFPGIEIIHLSLGGNDVLQDLIVNDPRVMAWALMLHGDPTISRNFMESPANIRAQDVNRAEALRMAGYRRPESDLNDNEKRFLTNMQHSLVGTVNDDLPEAWRNLPSLPEVLRPATDALRTIIRHIHGIKPSIRIMIAGYTQLFLRPRTVFVSWDEYNVGKKPKRNHGAGDYFMARRGMDWVFFNMVVMAELERQRQALAAQLENVHFRCFYFDSRQCDFDLARVNQYFGQKQYENDDYFKDIKGKLGGDGFHLNCKGYELLAKKLADESYLPWLRAATPRN